MISFKSKIDKIVSHPNYLTTSEAAERMGTSQEKVRILIHDGELPGSLKEHGRWLIPVDSVEGWIKKDSSEQTAIFMSEKPDFKSSPTSGHAELPGTPFWRWVLAVGAILGILSAVAGIYADAVKDTIALTFPTATPTATRTPTFTPTPTLTALPTATSLPFEPESDGEVLVIIATFYRTEGVVDTDIHNEIRRAIEKVATELDYSNLRVEVEPVAVAPDDRASAEALGERYNASIVLWGADTGVRVSVSYLNLKEPDFFAPYFNINETERTQLVNPSEYSNFILEDLPTRLIFLSLFAVSQSYYIEGKYYDAANTLEIAIDQNLEAGLLEDLPEAYFRLGWLYQEPMKNSRLAVDAYNKAIELNSTRASTYNNRGIAFSEQGDIDSAIADYNKAIELDPKGPKAYNNRGVAYIQQGNLEVANSDFNKAIELDPKFAQAYNNRGNILSNQGHQDAAIADFDKAIELDPEFAQAFNNRGIAYVQQGNQDAAIADFDKAIELDPRLAQAYYNRGNVLSNQGNLDAAIADFNKAIELDPEFAQAYNKRASISNNRSNLDNTVDRLTKAIEQNPNNAIAYYDLGLLHLNFGDPNAAIANFDKTIELDPEFAQAYNKRGVALRRRVDQRSIIRNHNESLYSTSLYRQYQVPSYQVQLFRAMEIRRKNEADLSGALSDLNKAIEFDSGNAEYFYNRGIVHYYLDDTVRGIIDFNIGAKLDYVLMDLYKQFGSGFTPFEQKNVHLLQAIADLNKAIELRPDFIAPHAALNIVQQASETVENNLNKEKK